MRVYSVFFKFKNSREEMAFACEMDSHKTIKWLSKDNNPKALDCEECEDDDGNTGVEFYFKKKKDAILFADQFSIPIKTIIKVDSYDNRNPWLPEGCDSIEDCIDIYGDVPGFR